MNGKDPERQQSWTNFVALVHQRANRQPTHRVFHFLTDGEQDDVWLTFSQLDEQARAIAARLESLDCQGQTALLLYGPGLDFVTAFLGCLYAGVVAVPTHLPRPRRPLARLEAIAADCGAKMILTTSRLLPELSARVQGHPLLGAVCWLTTDNVDCTLADRWKAPALGRDSIACLQYTSGSTADPKGVVLTHGNLLCNSQSIYEAFGHDPSSVGVIWLPPYHDMGLIGGILQPLYGGLTSVLMSPVHVVQRPLRWLKAIARFRAETSGGPNFVYDACIETIRDEDCGSLDLSCWRVAFNGAEPVRAETLDRFAEKFAPFGFRREAFLPCYGLAEGTLLVSGGPRSEGSATRVVSREGLENHQVAAPRDPADAVRVVGCGRPAPGQEVVIVDPESFEPCAEGRIGEIWVSGPSVAAGYWRRSQQTEQTFCAQLRGDCATRYLRTGDLGFLDGGRLFVTGRIKDLLIIDGRNHYPQDIELTVEKCHPALRSHGGAAFTIDDYGQRLVVVQEVERNGRRIDPLEIMAAIRRAVSEQHELAVRAIALVRVGGVPRTPSGKIQRRQCRELFLRGELPVLAEWREEQRMAGVGRVRSAVLPASGGDADIQADPAGPPGQRADRQAMERIQQWLVVRIAQRLECSPCEIDVRQPFAWYGLKSRDALELTGELEQWLGRRLSPTLTYDHPTIESLARHLAGETAPAVEVESVRATAAGLSEPVAIVGIGCRFPGASDPEAFWELLVEGRDAIAEVPPSRWNADAIDDLVGRCGASNVQGTVRWGGWLEGIDQFDPEFFGISPREAACIDPQHRLLLEVAWEALENAGQPADRLRGSKTGVFVGISTNDYRSHFMFRTSQLDPYWTTGNASSIAANRLSYFFDWRGPSVAVDTACSSSLVAVHWACNSLRAGECEMALAGGVNVILSPDISFSFVKGGGLAPDGRCKAFDARANGIVRSEGAGVVVLKLLSKALADGDRIYAVIRGGAVNQDGRTNGLTAPSQAAQEAVLREAWRNAGLSPGEAQYIETHGAGTFLGDVIEAKALATVLADGRPEGRRCALGSVKTNIGHCEAAAGIAGLIKVAMAMHHGHIPPTLHFREPNPHIRFEETPLFVQASFGPWPEQGGFRLAGVSSFGFGGTNAHLVVASPPPASPQGCSDSAFARPVHVLPLSAASPEGLSAVVAHLDDFLARSALADPEELASLCWMAATRRAHLDHRAALCVRTSQELREQIAAIRAGRGHPAVAIGKVAADRQTRVAFVFSGQGGQWIGMHRPLCEAFPAFREKLQECDALLRSYVDWSLLDELDADASCSRIARGDLQSIQISLFAFEVALAEAWKAWGIEPDAVVGHSMGEVAAACVAGALRLPDALRVIVQRSRLLAEAAQQLAPAGGMAAIRVSAEQAQALLRGYEDRVWVAVHNSPSYTVLSGDRVALEELVAGLRKQKVGARMMNVPGAAHTPQLEPTRLALEASLEGLQPQSGHVPFYSTVTGRRHAGTDLDAAYWGHNVRQSVRFAPAIDRLSEEGHEVFLEIGPHPLLTAAITQCVDHRGRQALAVASLRQEDMDLHAMHFAIGAMYSRGVHVAWDRVYPVRRRWISLPTYPWQRRRCWIDREPASTGEGEQGGPTESRGRRAPVFHPLLGRKLDLAAHPGSHVWETRLSPAKHRTLLDYRLEDQAMVPVEMFLEMAIAAAKEVFGQGAYVADELKILAALTVPLEAEVPVQIALEADGAPSARFRIFSRQRGGPPGSGWCLHAAGRILPVLQDEPARCGSETTLNEIRLACCEQVVPNRDQATEPPIPTCGPAAGRIAQLWRGPNKAVGQILLGKRSANPLDDGDFYPVLIDACCAVLAAARDSSLLSNGVFFAASGVGRFRWNCEPRGGDSLWVQATLDPDASENPETIRGHVHVWDEAWRLVLEACDVSLQRFAPRISAAVERPSVPDASRITQLLRAFREAPADERRFRLQQYLQAQIAHALETDPSRVGVEQPLMNLGIDSLMAMQIKARVEAELNVAVQYADLLEGPTVAKLADTLLAQLDRPGPSGQPHEESQAPAFEETAEPVAQEEAARLLEQLDNLPDDDLDAVMHRILSQ